MKTTDLLYKSQVVASWSQSLHNDLGAKSSRILEELHGKCPTEIMLAGET